jgi:CBS domain containing-hemolysin-like protein
VIVPDAMLIIVLGLLVIADLLTVAARAGLFQTHLARLVAQRDEDEEGFKQVSDLLHTQQRLRISLRFFLVILRFLIAGVLLAWLTVPIPNGLGWLLWVGILMLAALLLLTAEQVVEAFISRNPEKWAIRLASFAKVLMVMLYPFTAFFLLFNHQEEETREGIGTVTEDELKILVDAGQEDGVLEQDEREMIYSIFRLGDTLAREIMVPRIYITALDISLPLPQAVEALLASGHSRVPVYEESIDHIVGLLYAKDLLRLWLQEEKSGFLRDVTRPAYFVPEAKKVDELLDEMQARRIHMAIVIDEYGGVAGLVTLEDIVEEIIGEIRDEYDQAEELPYLDVGDGEYVFLGRVDLDDFNEVMGTHLRREEADTIGGFMYSRIGRVPVSGESVHLDDLVLTVEQVSGRRIRKIRARKIYPLPRVEGETDDHG